jgi:hypothetical protein
VEEVLDAVTEDEAIAKLLDDEADKTIEPSASRLRLF